MSTLYWIVALVAAARLAELVWARRNTRRLMAQGGIERGARHYPLIVALHAAWLAALVVFAEPGASLDWRFLGLFAVLQAARAWVLLSLGRFWTTRVITLPGTPLVRRGPYRLMRHPNYAVVAGEIAILPLVFGAWEIAVAFSVLNAATLWHRIGVENAALADRR